MKRIIVLLFILSVSPLFAANNPSKFYMTSSYKRSKKIWGTYNQYKESVVKMNSKGKRLYRRFYTTPLANLVIKKGEVHFIRPLQIEGKIKYQIKSFPYKRDRKKKLFKINPEGRNNELILFFQDNLKDLVKRDKKLKKMDIEKDNIEIVFEEFTCWQKRGKLHCQFPLSIQAKNNDIVEQTIKERLSVPRR
ncbi:MAG: hypothetical protein KC493_16400 [Bacteriovoracaceae bacterium]|nr:hypothetical protein [Bacteriovoracaceae bacterium]